MVKKQQQEQENKKNNKKITTAEWALLAGVSIMFALSILDRNMFTTMIMGIGWLAIVLALVAKTQMNKNK